MGDILAECLGKTPPGSQKRPLKTERVKRSKSVTNESGRLAPTSLDFRNHIHPILDELAKVIPFSRAVVFLSYENEQEPRLVVSRGLSSKQRREMAQWARDGYPGWVMENKSPLLIGDVAKEKGGVFAREGGLTSSILCVPILWEDRRLGVMGLESEERDAFTEEDLAFVGSFSEEITRVLVQRSPDKELEEQAREVSILVEIGKALAATLDQEELFWKIYQQVGRVMDNHAFFISLYEKGSNYVDIVFMVDNGKRYAREIELLGDGVASRSIKKRKPILLNRTPREFERLQPNEMNMFGNTTKLCRSLMAAPIILRERVIGAISTQSYRYNAYTFKHLNLLAAIASQSAIALENAQLYQTIKIERDRFDTILSNLDEGVTIISTDRKILYMNKWLSDQFGEDSHGKDCYRTFMGVEAPCPDCLLQNTSKNFENKKEKPSIEIETKNGRIFLVTGTLLTTPDGKQGVLELIKDITARKNYNKEFLQTEKLRSVVTLAGAVAHELNQPLTGITCTCSLLREAMQKDDKYYDDIREIELQAARLSDLIRKFQSITRLVKKDYIGKEEILDIEKSSSL